ncbi:MAG: sulfite exporter TauE/SafE family protein [Planctomycetaceae bacterium]|nr:sulfite exporter TauE/SafE family protein [Planctomycetaceae bacterium]
MDSPLVLVVVGFLLGTLGTLIGAGGGFVLVPLLLLMNPHERPEVITSISLAVVFVNATSGSLAYARMRRIDYQSGIWLAAATVPGAIAGALTTDYIPRRAFNAVFGVLMLAAAAYLFLHRSKPRPSTDSHPAGHTVRTIVEHDGTQHTFAYNMRLGLGLSVFVGYLSSLLGIGGGIIHVPALVYLLNFPVHVATATSHFILAIMALAGTLVHVATGVFTAESISQTIFLSIGVLVGAQAGAALSGRVHGVWILRSLAVALGLAGARILMMAIQP